MNLPLASLGNLFGPDTLIIFLVVLLLFGAKKLPELARGMGQAVREFSKAKDEIEREVTRPPEPPKALYEPRVEDQNLAHHETVVPEIHQDVVSEIRHDPVAETAPHTPVPTV